MNASAMHTLVELSLATSAAVVVVAALRKPLRRVVGAQLAYWLWLFVPVSALVVSLPPPSAPWELAAGLVPRFAVGALPAAMSAVGSVGSSASLTLVASIVWATGSLLMFASALRRQRALIRSLGSMTLGADGAYRSETVVSPVLVGVWRPRIVLPVDFELLYGPAEQALVLAHEEAHRRRGDILTNGIGTIWLCLSWFNPLMHWALGRLRFDQDLACDAIVLAKHGAQRRHYAEALLKAQLATQSVWRAPVGCYWQSSHPLKERIAMLKRPLPGRTRRWSGVLLTSALIVCGSYAAWAAQPEPQSAGQSEPANPLSRISADRVSTLRNGSIDYSGNVSFRWVQLADTPEMTWRADTISSAADGSTTLQGAVRISCADRTLTTERAIIEKDGTIRMDTALVSLTSRPL